MNTDQLMNLAFLSLLGAAIAASYIVSNRHNMGKMAQQAAIWALIFIGVIGAYGMWGQISQTVQPRQTFASASEIIVPRQADGHYYLTVDINDTPVDFIIDTGASQIVLSQADAARIGIDLNSLQFSRTAQTANGTVETAAVRLDSVRLGEINDTSVAAVVNGGAMDGSLLGMTYLNRFSSIAFRNGELTITR